MSHAIRGAAAILVLLLGQSAWALPIFSASRRLGPRTWGYGGWYFTVYQTASCGSPVYTTARSSLTEAQYCDQMGAAEKARLATADPSVCYSYRAWLTTTQCFQNFQWETNSVCNIVVDRMSRPKETHVPAFVLLSMNYDAPGNNSSMSYRNESARGATWSLETSSGAEVTVSLDGLLAGAGGEFSFTNVSSTTISSRTTASTQSVQAFFHDTSDYLRDTFVVWLNPILTKYSGCGGDTWVYSAGAAGRNYMPPGLDSTKPLASSFTARAFLNPALETEAWRRNFLTTVASLGAYNTILLLNPRITASGTASLDPYLDPLRFRPPDPLGTCPSHFERVQLRAPLNCDVSYKYSSDWQNTFSFKAKAKVPFLTVSPEMNYAYTSTYKQENSTSNSAALLIDTTTPGVCIDGQIFMDTMFNTYVVNSTTYACTQ